MEPSSIPPHVYQFRVVVQGISPLIWRRLLVRSDMSLAILHAMLQIMFAWSDPYLHSFHIYGNAYGIPRLDGPHLDIDVRHARFHVLQLYDQSWEKVNISRFLGSRPQPCENLR